MNPNFYQGNVTEQWRFSQIGLKFSELRESDISLKHKLGTV